MKPENLSILERQSRSKRRGMGPRARRVRLHATLLLLLSIVPARGNSAPVCKRLDFGGEVAAGAAWSASLGQGWMLKVLPIAPGTSGYSGWDLTVDRQEGTGYPDALLLATPPYGSLNEREIGTTFGLRAQDSIGWTPRSFRFLIDVASFAEAQQIYRTWMANGAAATRTPATGARDSSAMTKLLALQRGAGTGELRILDARLVPGTGNPSVFAQNWAIAERRMPHEDVAAAAGGATARGQLLWMKFAVTVWLPGSWAAPPLPASKRVPCPDDNGPSRR